MNPTEPPHSDDQWRLLKYQVCLIRGGDLVRRILEGRLTGLDYRMPPCGSRDRLRRTTFRDQLKRRITRRR